MAAGSSWDSTAGRHYRGYAPIDTRLFALRDGCYYFIGDPRDFGFAGQSYAYYGAHPVLDTYGGGWCFMMGPHTHLWAPWSPSFTVVGSWYYWHGPFDPYFWAYWPYYSYYYRAYYPSYYRGGRFNGGGGWRGPPPIRSVPAQAWRGSPARGAPAYRGAAQALRAPAAASAARTYAGQGDVVPSLPWRALLMRHRRARSRPRSARAATVSTGADSTAGQLFPCGKKLSS